MDENRHAEYEKAFRALKLAYVRRLYNTVRIVDNILSLEKIFPMGRNDLLRAQALVHSLAGSGTTFGFPAVTEAGQRADNFLEQFLKNNNADSVLSKVQRNQLLALLLDVQKICLEVYTRARREIPDFYDPSVSVDQRERGRNKILIVEDDVEISSMIAIVLEADGMTVEKMAAGADALHCLARTRSDLVLLDMNLTDMNGIEVLQQIKQNSEYLDIPVIMLATRYNEDDEQFCRHAGATLYIRKPVDAETLRGAVNSILQDDNLRVQSM